MEEKRINKAISDTGFCSRRAADSYIEQGRVTVNGEIAVMGLKVTEKDEIRVDGKLVDNKPPLVYIALNKPRGIECTTNRKVRNNIVDFVKHKERIFPIGRLDKDSEGLILLTNDGELNHKLLSPKNHVDKVYYAYLKEEAKEEDIRAFEKGVVLGDGYKCMPAGLSIGEEDRREVYVTLREGKFHQVKRMWHARGNEVEYLQRISFGSLTLPEDLEEGEFRELTEEELRLLRNENS